MADQEHYNTIEEIADRLQVSDQTVRRWIKSGRLPAFKPGREWRIRTEDLENFLESRSSPKAVAPPSLEPTFNDALAEDRRVQYLEPWAYYIIFLADKIEEEIAAEHVTLAWGLALHAEITHLVTLLDRWFLPLTPEISEREKRAMLGLLRAVDRLQEATDKLDGLLDLLISDKDRQEQKAELKRRFAVIHGEKGA